jgi:cellobiose phosphorylase
MSSVQTRPELRHTETSKERERLDCLVQKGHRALREGKPLSGILTIDELDILRRRYSHFKDERDSEGYLAGSSHLVTKVSTPRPFLHLISSNHSREFGTYGSFWDGSGAGFSCLETVLAGPVTSHKDNSYVPTAPRSTDHRHFYLREESFPGRPRIWHVFPQRGMEEEAYDKSTCEQGLGTVRIVSERNGIAAELLVYVPVNHPLEVWRIRLVNQGGGRRKLDFFLWLNWGLESYPGYYFDPRVVSHGCLYEDLNALVALNRDQNNKHPRTGFLMSRIPFESFDMSAEDFTGGGNFRPFPRAVEEGCCRNSPGLQPYMGMIAAMHLKAEIRAGEDKVFDFLLGVTEPDQAKGRVHLSGLSKYFFKDNGIETELASLGNSWSEMINRHRVISPDEEFDRFFNVWFKYQAKNTARWTRALDKVGYRDILQDLMSINSFNPEYTATMLPVALRYQYPDGSAVRQFARFEGVPHDMRMYMDSSSWIPDTLVDYLKETGDFGILEKEESFLNPETGMFEDDLKAAIYEHALRGVTALYKHRGLYGLCRIGHGDWNDALDAVGRNGQGVSVWLSMAAVYAARRFRELALWCADNENARLMDKIIDELTEAINRSAWDGSHYVYAFMADGTPVGSDRCEEGKIHLNVNSWSLFNHVAEQGGHVEEVLDSIERLRTALGYLLLYPAYTTKSKIVGRIADMAPGQFENASIYTHGQSFVIYALVSLGRGTEAFDALKKILPEETLPDIATGPSHQISNYSVGIENEHFGRNLYSNFCGALAWLRKSTSCMLGLLPDFDRLVIDPCIPAHWPEYRVEKVFRGCRVKAHFSNPDRVCRGVVKARMGNQAIPVEEGKASVPVDQLRGKKQVSLEVTLGA